MKYSIIHLTLFVLLPTFRLQAQEYVQITKSEVLGKVAEVNTNIKIAEQEFMKAKADYRQTNAVFLPNIAASHMGIATTNPLMAFGSKLNQEILIQSDFNPNMLNNPSQIENYATKFEIQQPLINVDGIFQRRAAKSKMDALALQQLRTSDHLMLEANKAYMQLQLAYKTAEVLEKALQTAFANKKIADDHFKQGFLQYADVLNTDVRVSEIKTQLQTAHSQIQNASNYLSFLMNDNKYATYLPIDSLIVNSVQFEAPKTVSENRSDIKAMSYVTKAYEAMNKADRMAFLPRLNAFGSYELYDDKLFQGDANGYLFGARLSWDIFNGGKRFGKEQKSMAEFQKSKLEYQRYVSQSQLEFKKAKRMYMDTQNRLHLAELTLQQSEEALKIRTNRFKEGLEKTSDLLLSESQYAQKQLAYYQTVFEHNYIQAYLQFLTKE
ncbi:TolC family protein [Snuella lapsa]|uniref:TolC family protein n=1 Tax=Snuella lapsa TaxID=870481 RepID=A0ABP6YNM4_9FLAO